MNYQNFLKTLAEFRNYLKAQQGTILAKILKPINKVNGKDSAEKYIKNKISKAHPNLNMDKLSKSDLAEIINTNLAIGIKNNTEIYGLDMATMCAVVRNYSKLHKILLSKERALDDLCTLEQSVKKHIGK